jgi:DMSO/TMAO reductase YedYZ molybdopterin-dependent catalytic subunit
MQGRRNLLKAAGGLALLGAGGWRALAAGPATVNLGFGNGTRELVAYPGKRPLIRLTTRPPQLETPLPLLGDAITPNDAFFVRYHYSDAPPAALDDRAHRLTVGGAVAKPLTLTLAELKRLPAAEITAVLQCSGNSRGFSSPRVAGGQLGHGAVGNARWRGVPLKTLLERAGASAKAVSVSFDGLDQPPLEAMPDFVKGLDIAHAMDGEVLVAWAMNGADLPILNGYPLRLVVPGHYGTYWVKHLSGITVLETPFDGYWNKSAYRIPDNDCACVPAGAKPDKTRLIGRYNVRSLITSVGDGARVKAGETSIGGIAFDGGSGIARVDLSADGGRTWQAATLGPDLGRYSFRTWRAALTLPAGEHALMARATAISGETQPLTASWNPAGYMRNVVETVRVVAA